MSLSATILLALLQAPSPRPEPFPVLVWRGPEAPRSEAAAELLAPFGGAVVIGTDEAAWVREAELDFFVFNAPGRDALHLERDEAYLRRWRRWFETRDDELLTRRPCLTDPDTRRELFARLSASLAARAGDTGLGVSLGDEVSLTPAGSPEDVCLSDSCRSAWAAFLERQPELDAADRERLADLARISTDAVRIELTEGGTAALGDWLLRRRFHQQVVLDLLAELAGRVRAQAPGTAVGLLGLAGQTAFGNVAVERALPQLDFVEAYSTVNARELVFTLRGAPDKPGGLDQEARAWATVFPDPARPNRAARDAWEHWLRGGDGLVIWDERALTQDPRLAARTARAVRDIRAVRAALPGFRPRPAAVAVVHSPDSLAASWMRDALLDGPTWPRRLAGTQAAGGTLEGSLDAWLRLLEDAGHLPGALPLASVGPTTVERFGTLVLDRVLVLSDGELERLGAFLEAGGALVVRGPLGWVDERGRERASDALTLLEESSPRVHLAPDWIADYAELRRPRDRERRRQLVDSLGWLPPSPAPFRVRTAPDDALPWLCAWAADPAGGWIGAAVPNMVGDLARHPLADLTLEVLPREGCEVVWIHPAAGAERSGRLPAGDAAVFRIVPD